MKNLKIIAGLTATLAGAANAGPVSKFEKKEPVNLRSQRPAGDIERCLIDLDGWLAPNVYRQPDRPGQTTLLWSTHEGVSVARVDLEQIDGVTAVRAWGLEKQVRGCAG